ncbi:hypothetical protein OSB04_013955 [Centaurea solstitialis]|uniref:Uncharacterized protein n=1 Tax=Centaurea solstitialis TaxID=347529 RepID=A0AA38WRJ4_9ASTR|nr:hypothetical protein OSB04_013955 [Centaurea solstitialis]
MVAREVDDGGVNGLELPEEVVGNWWVRLEACGSGLWVVGCGTLQSELVGLIVVYGSLAETPSSVEFHPQCVRKPPTAGCDRIKTCGAHPRTIIPLSFTLSSNPSSDNHFSSSSFECRTHQINDTLDHPAETPSSVEFHPQCVRKPPTAGCDRIKTCGAHPRTIIPLSFTLSSNPSSKNHFSSSSFACLTHQINGTLDDSNPKPSSIFCSIQARVKLPKQT